MAFSSKMPAKKAAIKSTVIMISGKATAARGEEARKCTASMEIISTNYAPKSPFILGRSLAFHRCRGSACSIRRGLWLSFVERCVRDAEAVGSNPTSPTTLWTHECERVPKDALFFQVEGD